MLNILLLQSPGNCREPEACWQVPSQVNTSHCHCSHSPLCLMSVVLVPPNQRYVNREKTIGRSRKHLLFGDRILDLSPFPSIYKWGSPGPVVYFSEPQFTHLWRRENVFFMKILCGLRLWCHHTYKRTLCIRYRVKTLFQMSCFPLASWWHA